MTHTNHYTTVTTAIKQLKERGYTHEFKVDGDKFACYDNNKSYYPSELEIHEYHRIEGQSDGGDMFIVYAMECSDGEKGIISDAYGPYANPKVSELIKQISIQNQETIV